jgi:transposase
MQPNPMSEPITLQPHLSIDALEMRYRRAKAPIERSQLQILWLIAQGKSTEEAASITGYNPNWVYQLICRYNQVGPEEFIDKRNQNPALFLSRLLTQVNAFSAIKDDFVQEEILSSELRVNSTYLTFL